MRRSRRVGVLGFLFHLVVDALVQRHQALILVTARMQEILIACRQFAAQQLLEVIDDFGMAFHDVLQRRNARMVP